MIRLPDGQQLYTDDLSDEHTQKVIRHWVDRHSDEYELPEMRRAQVSERARDPETGEWLFENEYGQVVKSRDGDAHVRPGSNLRPIKESQSRIVDIGESTGKKLPQCGFELVDMPEAQYREMRPYQYHPTCRTPA